MTPDTSIRILSVDDEIKELQAKLGQTDDLEKEKEIKLQILGLQGQRLKSHIGMSIFRKRMHEAAQVASSRIIQGINSD